MKCPCKNCLLVARCRRQPPDDVVRKCDLVYKYLEMEGSLRSISYISTPLSQEELDRRFGKIIECLGLQENGGCYIGSKPSPRTVHDGEEFLKDYRRKHG